MESPQYASAENTAHMICIKWGDKYPAEDVNRLYSMLKRNIHHHHFIFHCFTDQQDGLHQEITCHPLPEIAVDPGDLKYVYRKEVGLCDDQLGGLNGKRVYFFDLDVIITDELDTLIDFPEGDAFVIINDWNSKGNQVGQASCYSWKVGTLGFVKADFESRPKEIIKQYFTASQEYLSAQVISHMGPLNFWPDDWCKSFKQHALPNIFLRPWVAPHLPEGTKLLAFHGDPKINHAIEGRWSDKPVPLAKRLYKTIRPAPWIAEYWR